MLTKSMLSFAKLLCLKLRPTCPEGTLGQNFLVVLLLWLMGCAGQSSSFMLYCCAHLLYCLLPALAHLHAPHGTCHKVNRRLWDRKWLRTSLRPWNEHGQSPLRTGMQSEWVHIWVTRNAPDAAESVLPHWPLCSYISSLQPFHDHTTYIPWRAPEQISKQQQWGLSDTDAPCSTVPRSGLFLFMNTHDLTGLLLYLISEVQSPSYSHCHWARGTAIWTAIVQGSPQCTTQE